MKVQRLLILFCMTTSIMQVHGMTKLKRGLGDFLCCLITHSPIPKDQQLYVENLLKELNPSDTQLVAAKNLNSLGEYLFGYYNTVALPFLNYLVINTKALKKLPEQTRRFIIGRSLYKMKQGKNYVLYHLLLPFLCNIAVQLCTSADEQSLATQCQGVDLLDHLYHNTLPITDMRDGALTLLKVFGLKIGAQALCSYTQRTLEEEADLETAKHLNCCQGGIRALTLYQRFHNDGTVLGRLHTLFPFLTKGLSWGIALLLHISDPKKTHTEVPLRYSGIGLPAVRWDELLENGLNKTPGTLGVYSNAFQYALWKLPLLRSLSPYPLISHRIAALTQLDSEMKPEIDPNIVLER